MEGVGEGIPEGIPVAAGVAGVLVVVAVFVFVFVFVFVLDVVDPLPVLFPCLVFLRMEIDSLLSSHPKCDHQKPSYVE